MMKVMDTVVMLLVIVISIVKCAPISPSCTSSAITVTVGTGQEHLLENCALWTTITFAFSTGASTSSVLIQGSTASSIVMTGDTISSMNITFFGSTIGSILVDTFESGIIDTKIMLKDITFTSGSVAKYFRVVGSTMTRTEIEINTVDVTISSVAAIFCNFDTSPLIDSTVLVSASQLSVTAPSSDSMFFFLYYSPLTNTDFTVSNVDGSVTASSGSGRGFRTTHSTLTNASLIISDVNWNIFGTVASMIFHIDNSDIKQESRVRIFNAGIDMERGAANCIYGVTNRVSGGSYFEFLNSRCTATSTSSRTVFMFAHDFSFEEASVLNISDSIVSTVNTGSYTIGLYFKAASYFRSGSRLVVKNTNFAASSLTQSHLMLQEGSLIEHSHLYFENVVYTCTAGAYVYVFEFNAGSITHTEVSALNLTAVTISTASRAKMLYMTVTSSDHSSFSFSDSDITLTGGTTSELLTVSSSISHAQFIVTDVTSQITAATTAGAMSLNFAVNNVSVSFGRSSVTLVGPDAASFLNFPSTSSVSACSFVLHHVTSDIASSGGDSQLINIDPSVTAMTINVDGGHHKVYGAGASRIVDLAAVSTNLDVSVSNVDLDMQGGLLGEARCYMLSFQPGAHAAVCSAQMENITVASHAIGAAYGAVMKSVNAELTDCAFSFVNMTSTMTQDIHYFLRIDGDTATKLLRTKFVLDGIIHSGSGSGGTMFFSLDQVLIESSSFHVSNVAITEESTTTTERAYMMFLYKSPVTHTEFTFQDGLYNSTSDFVIAPFRVYQAPHTNSSFSLLRFSIVTAAPVGNVVWSQEFSDFTATSVGLYQVNVDMTGGAVNCLYFLTSSFDSSCSLQVIGGYYVGNSASSRTVFLFSHQTAYTGIQFTCADLEVSMSNSGAYTRGFFFHTGSVFSAGSNSSITNSSFFFDSAVNSYLWHFDSAADGFIVKRILTL